MKKMFKKSIAMLIAVLMVISAMPFTAITASAADDATKKADVISKINAGFSGYQGEASAPADNTMSKSNLAKNSTYGVDDKMQNVLYQKAINDGPWTNNVTSVGTSKAGAVTYNVDTGLQYGDIAFLYDGQTNPAAVVASYFTSNSKEGGMRSLDPKTSGFEMKTTWHSSGSTSKDYSTISDWCFGNGYYKQIGSIVSGAFGATKNNRYFYNSLYYTGTPSSTVTTVNNIDWNITVYSSSSSYDNNTGSITFGNSNATGGSTTIYVVNYKPVYDAIVNIKNIYNNQIKGKESEFCADSLTAFYNAAYDIMNLNPNDSKYNYSSDLSGAVNSVGEDIDALATQISTVNAGPAKHTLVDIPGKDATCGETGLTVGKKCSRCGTVTVAQTEIPATGKHDYVYTKKDSSVHTVTCNNCDYSAEEAHDTLDGGKCSKCGYIALDLDAYNAANDVVLSILSKDKDKYTEESLTKYKKAVQPYLSKQNEFTSQDQVNDATAKIVSAEVLLQKQSVTIKFVVEKEDGTSFTKDSKTADWGHSVNLDTQSNYVSKWTITVNGVTSKIDSNATDIEHVATEDATITAYVSNDETETVKYSKVTFLGKNSAVVGIKYVAVGTTVETDTLLTVPAIPFYEDGQWDKAEIKADGSDITVRATYVPKAGDENKCGIHFNGDTKYYNYDSYVYLFNADKSKKYAMYADANETQLITYFDGVDFYAPRRDNLYIKEVTDTSAMTATIGFTGFYKQDTTSSFNVKFWLPEGATLVETGVDLVAKFPNGTVKSAHDRATKFSERNEYTYSAKFSDSQKTIEFKPYLTYKKGGTTTTVYGTSQTVEY